ncbi:MAG: histidine phosphatase family protein [Ottowia sp.]|uniref:histidine phosphatase family protein n=1 Tax=Ottowia sp. TaxID=1898956 RepID=UPI003C70A411
MKKEPTLWLVRHAPVLAEKGLCYGVSNLLADDAATSQTAEVLAANVPEGVAVHVSPLQRCQQLAWSLQLLRPDLRFNEDPRLREMDFGAWEGQPWASIKRAEFDVWLADFAHVSPGGGESVAALMARVAQAWDEWAASAADALWITHAGVMRAALLLSRGIRLPATAADWPSANMPYGEVLILQAPQGGQKAV